MDLALIKDQNPAINCVNISFVRPDCLYSNHTFDNTGLQFSQDFKVVQAAIKILKSKGVTVMLSVGGGSYWSESKSFNTVNVASLADDLGCDGIDLDWEVGALKAYELTNSITSLKNLNYKGKISFAGWSTGAYGSVKGSDFQGMNIHAMTQQGSNVDWINIMTYDAGPTYDPIGAYDSYRLYYRGPLNIGFEIGTQGWGGYLLTKDDVARMATHVKEDGDQNGAFIWALNKPGNPSVSDVITLCQSIFVKPQAPPPTPVIVNASIECPVCKSNFILQK